MERRSPPPPKPAAEDAAPSTTHGGPHAALAELTDRDAVRPSRREGARAHAQVYASVTGEGGQGDVAASTAFAPGRPGLPAGDAARYEAGPLLGQGGMGEVVLHLDHVIGRHVARKTLLREAASDRAFTRFVREARVQGQLEHPSVVPVYDFGVGADGGPFFTMKRVRGETLALILERLAEKDPEYTSRFSRHKLLAAFRQVCLAVEYAHLRGVVHRDLKPSNIMLGDFGEVYVLDWGLAKLRSDDAADPGPASSVRDGRVPRPADSPDRTGEGDMVGTPAYMAPEQFGAGRNRFDTRQDVFALGAVLFEILTLARYRPGASFATLLPSLLREADREHPTRPSEKAADITPELDDACTRALATDPALRLDSAAAISEVIERYLEGDRDQGMRTALAAKLLASARARIAAPRADASAHVDAMRDAIKALALTPDDVEAQRLLLALVVDGSGRLPPEAMREWEESEMAGDEHALRLALAGLASWFIAIPLAMWVGVRSWTMIPIMSALVLATMGYMVLLMRWRTRATRHMVVLNVVIAATLAMTSCWLGPFILVPLSCSAVALIFGSRCKASERPWIILIWALAILLPFGVELLHVFPPAYTFADGQLVLHPRVLDLPERPTLVALAYTSVTFMLLPMMLIGQLRDRQQRGDRRLFVQAWHLRQLFPAASDKR